MQRNPATAEKLVTLLVLTSSIELLAQGSPELVPGARVRVSALTVPYGKMIGTVISLTADTLVIENENLLYSIAVPISSVSKLEVSRGQKSAAGKGAGIGFVVGAVIGAAIGVGLGANPGFCAMDELENGDTCIGEVAPLGAVGLGLLGAGIGAAVGAARPLSRFEILFTGNYRGGGVK